MDKPLVNKKYKLQRYPGKGGWVYAVIKEIGVDKRIRGGWVQVSGTVDGFELTRYKLMPMKDGNLFFPIRAEIRKAINKKQGDTVHIILYEDHSSIEIPDEFLLCLEDEPAAKTFFFKLTESEQSYYVKWIYEAKQEATKTKRIVAAIGKLMKRKFFYELSKTED